jgi:hypothetical protein
MTTAASSVLAIPDQRGGFIDQERGSFIDQERGSRFSESVMRFTL